MSVSQENYSDDDWEYDNFDFEDINLQSPLISRRPSECSFVKNQTTPTQQTPDLVPPSKEEEKKPSPPKMTVVTIDDIQQALKEATHPLQAATSITTTTTETTDPLTGDKHFHHHHHHHHYYIIRVPVQVEQKTNPPETEPEQVSVVAVQLEEPQLQSQLEPEQDGAVGVVTQQEEPEPQLQLEQAQQQEEEDAITTQHEEPESQPQPQSDDIVVVTTQQEQPEQQPQPQPQPQLDVIVDESEPSEKDVETINLEETPAAAVDNDDTKLQSLGSFASSFLSYSVLQFSDDDSGINLPPPQLDAPSQQEPVVQDAQEAQQHDGSVDAVDDPSADVIGDSSSSDDVDNAAVDNAIDNNNVDNDDGNDIADSDIAANNIIPPSDTHLQLDNSQNSLDYVTIEEEDMYEYSKDKYMKLKYHLTRYNNYVEFLVNSLDGNSLDDESKAEYELKVDNYLTRISRINDLLQRLENRFPSLSRVDVPLVM